MVADEDMATAATIMIPAATGGGAVIRVTDHASTYDAGNNVGFIAAIRRLGSLAVNPFAFVRTYLNESLQEEVALTASSGINVGVAAPGAALPYTFVATRPFDAIEFVVESQAITGYFEVKIFEACVNVRATDGAPDGLGQPRAPAAVVADLSTGANPYHRVFRRDDWTDHPSQVIPGFPVDAPALNLSFGEDLQRSLELDALKWAEMQTGVIYWIPRTNLLYVRTRQSDEAFPGALRDPAYEIDNHGVATAGVIAKACPSCYLLVVSDPEGGFTASVDFIARNTPWVDVAVSTQQATVITAGAPIEAANGLILSQLAGPLSPYAQAAKRWVDTGKLYFIASGNFPIGLVGYPVPVPTTDRAIPPWFTVVGGSYSQCRGVELNSGKPTEFTSEYVAIGPASNSVDEYAEVSGTSFSTPLVATHFAQALKRLRQVLGDTRAPGAYWAGAPRGSAYLSDGLLTRDDLYDAFTQAADLFASDEFTGPCGSNGVAVTPLPWLEMGWGHIGERQAEIAADLILGTLALPPPMKPDEQRRYMEAYRAIRELYGSVSP